MRHTNIKKGIKLKKQGAELYFKDCPVCRSFYCTDEPELKTCSALCDKVFEDVKTECLVTPKTALGYL